jgi:hypothetical protein
MDSKKSPDDTAFGKTTPCSLVSYSSILLLSFVIFFEAACLSLYCCDLLRVGETAKEVHKLVGVTQAVGRYVDLGRQVLWQVSTRDQVAPMDAESLKAKVRGNMQSLSMALRDAGLPANSLDDLRATSNAALEYAPEIVASEGLGGLAPATFRKVVRRGYQWTRACDTEMLQIHKMVAQRQKTAPFLLVDPGIVLIIWGGGSAVLLLLSSRLIDWSLTGKIARLLKDVEKGEQSEMQERPRKILSEIDLLQELLQRLAFEISRGKQAVTAKLARLEEMNNNLRGLGRELDENLANTGRACSEEAKAAISQLTEKCATCLALEKMKDPVKPAIDLPERKKGASIKIGLVAAFVVFLLLQIGAAIYLHYCMSGVLQARDSYSSNVEQFLTTQEIATGFGLNENRFMYVLTGGGRRLVEELRSGQKEVISKTESVLNSVSGKPRIAEMLRQALKDQKKIQRLTDYLFTRIEETSKPNVLQAVLMKMSTLEASLDNSLRDATEIERRELVFSFDLSANTHSKVLIVICLSAAGALLMIFRFSAVCSRVRSNFAMMLEKAAAATSGREIAPSDLDYIELDRLDRRLCELTALAHWLQGRQQELDACTKKNVTVPLESLIKAQEDKGVLDATLIAQLRKIASGP